MNDVSNVEDKAGNGNAQSAMNSQSNCWSGITESKCKSSNDRVYVEYEKSYDNHLRENTNDLDNNNIPVANEINSL
jgi:hypothetical protein